MDYPQTFSNWTFTEGINQITRLEFLFSLPFCLCLVPSGLSNDIGKIKEQERQIRSKELENLPLNIASLEAAPLCLLHGD